MVIVAVVVLSRAVRCCLSVCHVVRFFFSRILLLHRLCHVISYRECPCACFSGVIGDIVFEQGHAGNTNTGGNGRGVVERGSIYGNDGIFDVISI